MALGAFAAFAAFMWQMTKAKHERALKRGIEKAREVESKAADELIKGVENENKIQADNTVDRSKFLD